MTQSKDTTLDDPKTFVQYSLHMMGFYPYHEIVNPVLAMVNNSATKEDIDYIGSITKRPYLKRKMAKLYDDYQEKFSPTKGDPQ